MLEAVRECGGGRLVDDAYDVETREFTGIPDGLLPSIFEVSGDGDDSRRDWHVKVVLDLLFQLGEYHGTDLLGGELL